MSIPVANSICALALTLTIIMCNRYGPHGGQGAGGLVQKAQQPTARDWWPQWHSRRVCVELVLSSLLGALKGGVMDAMYSEQHYLYAPEPTNARTRPKSRVREASRRLYCVCTGFGVTRCTAYMGTYSVDNKIVKVQKSNRIVSYTN